MHVQKNMNVYDDITLSYEIVHIQHIHTHSVYSYTFTQGRNNMHAQKNMNVYYVFTFQCTNGLMIV